MNKVLLTVSFVFGMTASAMAHTHSHPHKHTTVPLPPTRPANLTPPVITSTGAIVAPTGVTVKAPKGSDVQVDVDGKDVDISVDGNGRSGWSKIYPWNWSIWH